MATDLFIIAKIKTSKEEVMSQKDIWLQQLEDLKFRLANIRWPQQPLQNSDWSYGAELNCLKRITQYWQDKFVWNQVEQQFNQFPQFRTTIDSVSLHFIQINSNNPRASCLLLLHG